MNQLNVFMNLILNIVFASKDCRRPQTELITVKSSAHKVTQELVHLYNV